MEMLDVRGQSMRNALISLKEALQDFAEQVEESRAYRTHRDSVIKRFEYCEELFWKVLHKYLRENQSVVADTHPKDVYRKCVDVGLLLQKEFDLCIKMVKDRNLTSHMYHEQVAEYIVGRAAVYYEFMDMIIRRIAD